MVREPERWKEDYARDGYIVVRDVVDEELLDRLRAGIDDITRDPDAMPDHLRRHLDFERNYVAREPHMNEFTSAEVGNALRNIMELPLFDRVFAEFILHDPLLDVLEALFESAEFSFHNYKCIIKAPRISSRFRWHRDLPYLFHTTPNLITAMICLDDMTEENGATVVLPGSHAAPYDRVTSADVDIAPEKLPPIAPVTVACPAGSAVLFHASIIHGGGANRSAGPRRNVIGIWAGPETYPVNPYRYAYQGIMPRSADSERRLQVRMSFPRVFAERTEGAGVKG